jgi:hypothetical protein
MSESTESEGLEARCDYCRRPREEVGKLIRGGDGEHPVTICRACVTQAAESWMGWTPSVLQAGAAGDDPLAP